MSEPLSKSLMMNASMFLVLAIVLFYFGWGLEWITERHITQWLR